MKGAEIALVPGTRVKVGRGDDCDIVLADSSLAELAFELEVSEDGVTMVRSTGEMVAMRPFEVQDFGTTSVAMGPAEGEWQPLVHPQPEPESEPEKSEEAENPSPEESAPAAESTSTEPVAEPAPRGRRHGCLFGLLALVVLLLLLAVAAWWFLGRDGEWAANSRKLWEQGRSQAEQLMGSGAGTSRQAEPKPEEVKAAQARAAADLLELASKNGLQLVETNGVRKLKGNVKLRTERLALRSLALAADRMVKLDLTDDETLCRSANETLQSCSDGAIKAVLATNRVVKLEGYAPTPAALEKVLRALNEDVKGVENLDTSAVAVGGIAPVQVADTPFVAQSEPTSEPAQTHPTRKAASGSARDYPIAGILMVPFPCVVMRDGTKLIEGAQIGSATLEKIEADRLTLKDGGRKVEWRP